MGKFSDALDKSRSEKKRPTHQTLPQKHVETQADAVEAIRLDTSAQVTLAEESFPINGDIDPRLISFVAPQSPAAEEFKLMRARIFCKNMTCKIQTILVTSSQPLDGKTLVAANLAVSIAQGINEHVLLVDCDLRLPSLHRCFGLQVRQGLREYLEEGKSLASYLLKTPVRKLTLLPAGLPPPNPSELLSSEKMRLLIAQLKARYHDRYIIIDAAPAQFSAETASLSNEVDRVLLVVRSGQTPKEAILAAIDNIGREKILGLVFNANNENEKIHQTYYRRYQQK